ncbi:serine hydrolase domain-containing protein [Hyalangium rubrum]|uniref:Serine hydrolase n=1 Tax=Hyalangium rubrum TaxID=3103134 RepID=A0ABU5H7I2_9BACT|nr:serine hydrolase [Hyalangium sp. s54d21]MDY7228040.1 serine hydrolase [Hyalangium sp. s54d21]
MNVPHSLKLLLLLVSLACGCKHTPVAEAHSSRHNGWELSDAHADRERLQVLKDRIARNEYKDIRSIIVIRDGKLLVEEYFNGATAQQLHDVRSVGKTFASALMGIALQEGHLRSVEQPLSEFYDLTKYQNFSPAKASVTLEHLVTMNSAFEGNDNDAQSVGNEENMYPQGNWVEWTLNLPMDPNAVSGKRWSYFTAGVVLLGDVLNLRVPGGLERYADSKLFKPLGIERYQWVYTPQGAPSLAGGLQLAPLDFAKFGQLYKNNGRWGEQQILSPEWVARSLSRHHATTFPGDSYGYLWWNKVYRVGEQAHETFYCSGNGGNKIFVFKDQPLVIVVTSSAYNRRYMHKQVDEMMEQFILPAVLGR